MRPETNITCDCGQVAIMLEGRPIVSAECLCTSCQKAGEYLQSLPGAAPLLDEKGATHFVLYRKDRVQCKIGAWAAMGFRTPKIDFVNGGRDA